MAKLLKRRLDDLYAAENLEQFRSLPQARCHELTQDRKGQLAIDLEHPKRLILKPANSPVPLKPDNGLDWARLTTVEIIEIVDYH
jgi:proteic killer suppression protein